MNIYLIGLPAAGKTTIAKHLAQALDYQYIDLDTEIEKDSLMFIDSIFEKHGEAFFRTLETKTLKKISNNYDNYVIALGGGIVEVKENKQLLDGLVIYLDVDLDILKTRMNETFIRPILNHKSLETLSETRFFKYRDFSDYIVSNETSIEKTIENILKIVEENQK